MRENKFKNIVKKIGNVIKKAFAWVKEKKIILYTGIVLLVFLLLALIYYLISFYYNSHFYANTRINGVKVSSMSVSRAQETMKDNVSSYSLTLEERKNVKEKVTGKDIKLHTVLHTDLKELLEQQNGYAWPVYLIKKNHLEIESALKYDETLLKTWFDSLKCFETANIVEPANAHISGYGKNGYTLVPEVPGNKVKSDFLYAIVKKAILELKTTLSLEEENCYEGVTVTSKSKKLNDALNRMNKLAATKITYEFGENNEIVDAARISKWLSMDTNCQVKLDKAGIKEFVDYIGSTYNTFGKVRTFKTSYGKVIDVKGGDYGWWLNRIKEAKELEKLIFEGANTVRKPAYYQTAMQHGKDDIGNTYVEVNLTAQHLFYYKEGKLILETDFVSGNVSKNLGTPTGTYPVQYKQEDATLNGEDYSTPVKYWMPFNRNIGLHDASWRDSFGKDIYKTRGSHGCVNMPKDAAEKMFQSIEKGVPVVVYTLEGTEN